MQNYNFLLYYTSVFSMVGPNDFKPFKYWSKCGDHNWFIGWYALLWKTMCRRNTECKFIYKLLTFQNFPEKI